jgi:hypothetical protein
MTVKCNQVERISKCFLPKYAVGVDASGADQGDKQLLKLCTLSYTSMGILREVLSDPMGRLVRVDVGRSCGNR